MDFKQYQRAAGRTRPTAAREEQVKNFALGLTGESGEVADYLKKVFYQGHELERDKLLKELGDVLWYIANLADVYDINLEEIAVANIEKLKQRYPDGFSEERSVHRQES